MKKIFLDKRVSKNSRDNCVPCITNLYQQLQAGKEEIELEEAYQC